MICPRCQTENSSEARFCMNCGLAFTRRCSNCNNELTPGSRFCMYCGQPVLSPTPIDDNRLSRLAAAAPDPLVQKMRTAVRLVGERRMVTALLVDVVGSTTLAEQVDIEDWAMLMNGMFDRIVPVIYRYEGTVARMLGDSLLAFFGSPVAHEDDAVRAVRVGLEIIEGLTEYSQSVKQKHGIDFSVRVCINTGPVVIRSIGDNLRYEYTAIGDAVNLTSRLKFAARPMMVLISEHTYRFIAPLFECKDLGLLESKAGIPPIRAYQVVGTKVIPGRVRGFATLTSPMVGRDNELRALLKLCETVRAGLGRAVLILGEPGLGKTRLIAEWQRATEREELGPEAHWISGHCLSFGQGLAYRLIGDVLRSMLGLPNSDCADCEPELRQALYTLTQRLFGEGMLNVYPYLGHMLALDLEAEILQRIQVNDPQALQIQYLEALRSLFLALAKRNPLVLVLEDLHWADPSSIELLIKLLPVIFNAPILFCMSMRPDHNSTGWKLVSAAREQLGSSLSEITLSALTDFDARQLVANLLAIEALPEGMRSLILRKAEGNPFFVEEVIRMMIDRGIVVQKNGGWEAASEIIQVDIPDNLQGLLQARIDRLPEDVKYTLLVASVIGRQFPVRVLEEVLERSNI